VGLPNFTTFKNLSNVNNLSVLQMKRRRFLQVAGVAGVAAGCSSEAEKWVPVLVPNEELVPGIPTYYASTCRECPAGCGILVKTRESRVIKIEGNPEHPVNRGRLCARGQSALQGLYDPDRVTQPMKRTGGAWQPMTWDAALTEIGQALATAAAAGANRVGLVTGAQNGVVDGLYDRFLAAFRSNRRLRYEAFGMEPLREATRLVFGAAGVPRYDFGAAQYVLSFGADFLETWLSPTEFARGFAASHGYHEGRMSKFVACSPRRGSTAFSADEWHPPKPGTEHILALGIAASIVRQGKARAGGAEADRFRGFLARFDGATVSQATGVSAAVVDRIAAEFADAEPSLAVGGGIAAQHRAATQLEVAAHILNVVAGNVGRTVHVGGASVWDRVSGHGDMMALVAAMNAGEVDVLFVQGGANPAYTLPATAGFAEAFGKVRLKVAFATMVDETAALADIVLPDHHSLESWDAIEPVPGVTSFQQPAMQPVTGSRQAADVLIALAQGQNRSIAPAGVTNAQGLVAAGRRDLNEALRKGVAGAPAAPRGAARTGGDFARLSYDAAPFDESGRLPLMLVPSLLYDGRGANKQMLQELPDPATKLAWQTWVEIHPSSAGDLVNGDVVTVTAGNRTVEALVYVWPGVMPGVVAMPLGQGHTSYGRFARGRGSNPVALLAATATDPSGALAYAQTGVSLTKTGWRPLATTEGSARQHDRGIARLVSYQALHEGHEEHAHDPFTEPEKRAMAAHESAIDAAAALGVYAREHPKWEMAIDLSRCTGCSACVAACYIENNIPAVGEDQVVRSREMSWIRIERYFEGDTAGSDFQVAQIPMLCQHCEDAPCEPVCPVYAAYHTPDGLNGQIYNRCVGTRYCANNCPYKVRYFNFWDYGAPSDPRYAFPGTLHLGLNPDVTVRTKGVMEKCTFCVQRIRHAQNDARVRGRTGLDDGEVVPACAQTCPSDAIVFGNARDPESRVARIKRDERGYVVFGMLNTKPGITYLSRVVHTQESH
jgi:anaerobic selenocysteine-containing dehydrogenase/Fe-S-cluster-containing dehydrogenase component